MNSVTPFLDNIETVGIKKDSNTGQDAFKKKTLYNRKRGNRVSGYARQNVKFYNQLAPYIMGMDSGDTSFDYFINLKNRIQNCASHTLVRVHENPNTIEYIGAHTCKNKLCHVCNYERSKMVRRKYRLYLDKNEFVDKQTGEVQTKDDFDFMHLTLTVPHSQANGFRNKQWYADELIKEFNYLRKKAFWKERVFGGEFGVEVTRNTNGLHIHIHSLLIVRKSKQNRNELHRWLMLNWNMQTLDIKARRTEFKAEDYEAIRKGNKTLTDADLAKLNPKGSTLISLENLFVFNISKVGKFDKWDAEKKRWKHYVNSGDTKEFMSGVLECIKYHFEPMALNQDDKTYDLELLREILPAIKGKPLYRKFGNLHGVKELNINETIEGEIEDIVKETANQHVTHPETGSPVTNANFKYMMLSAKSIFYDKENNFRPFIKKSAKKVILKEDTLKSALQYMMNLSWRTAITSKSKIEMQIDDELMRFDEFNPN